MERGRQGMQGTSEAHPPSLGTVEERQRQQAGRGPSRRGAAWRGPLGVKAQPSTNPGRSLLGEGRSGSCSGLKAAMARCGGMT